MSQKLALPLNTCEINVGYKKTYAPGYNINGTSAIHYGVDFIGYTYANNYRFFASGNGVVLGVNNTFIPDEQRGTLPKYTVGKWVAVKYYDVEGYGDLVVRYFHMDNVEVSVGQQVTLNTVLGSYGETGDYCFGKHIHVEVDTDTQYWNYTPTISRATACGLKKGYTGDNDTTINPLSVFKVKVSKPEEQTCTVHNDGEWCANITIPESFT